MKPSVNTIMPKTMKNRTRPARDILVAVIVARRVVLPLSLPLPFNGLYFARLCVDLSYGSGVVFVACVTHTHARATEELMGNLSLDQLKCHTVH